MKKINTAIIFSLLCLIFLWGIAPAFFLTNNVFSGALIIQIILTCAIVLGWLVFLGYCLFGKEPPFQGRRHPPTLSLAIQKQLYRIKKKLNSTDRHHAVSLGKKRFGTILMGHQNAGKTSLLMGTGSTWLCHPDEQKNTHQPTRDIHAWIKPGFFFLDTAGAYQKTDQPASRSYWQAIWNHMQTVRTNWQCIVLVINITDLQGSVPAIEAFAHSLIQPLQQMPKRHMQLPLCLIFNGCDQLVGFTEFFGELDSDEREEILGFELPPLHNSHFNRELAKNIQSFLYRIEQRLTHHLQHQPLLEKRKKILEFTQQFTTLTAPIKTLLDTIHDTCIHPIYAAYFTSCNQAEQKTIDLITHDIETTYAMPIQKNLLQKPLFSKSYFIKKLWGSFQNLTLTQNPIVPAGFAQKLTPYLIAALLILISTFSSIQHYHKGSVLIAQLQEMANTTSTSRTLDTSLQRTLHLRQIINRMSEQGGKRWLGYLNKNIVDTYNQQLTQHFAGRINGILTKTMAAALKKNEKNEVYAILKIYNAMLSHSTTDKSLITTWFKTWWTNNHYPASQQLLFIQSVTDLLSLNTTTWPADDTGVFTQARAYLNQLSPAQLVYLKLESQYAKDPEKVIHGDNIQVQIPWFYSLKNFQTIMNTDIPHLSQSFKAQSGKTLPKLTQQVQALYEKNFSKAWQTALDHVIFTPENYKQAHTLLKALEDTKSDLWATMKQVTDTLNNSHFQQASSSSLQYFIAWQNWMNNAEAKKNWQSQLDRLDQNLIQSLISSRAPARLAFHITRDTFRNPDGNLINNVWDNQDWPEPVRSWTSQLIAGVWELMLADTRDHINKIWSDAIYPFYDKNINQRFPVFSHGTESTSITAFTTFFGPSGHLEQFFNAYIKPYTNTENTYWTWSHFHGTQLEPEQSILDTFIRSSLIQRMFFLDNSKIPTLKFSLKPLLLSSNINRFILNINGIILDYNPHVQQAAHLTWHALSPAKNPHVSIQFSTLDLKKPSQVYKGTWDWLELINHSAVKMIDAKTFHVTFSVGTHTALFELKTSNMSNPYLPHVLYGFTCPAVLLPPIETTKTAHLTTTQHAHHKKPLQHT